MSLYALLYVIGARADQQIAILLLPVPRLLQQDVGEQQLLLVARCRLRQPSLEVGNKILNIPADERTISSYQLLQAWPVSYQCLMSNLNDRLLAEWVFARGEKKRIGKLLRYPACLQIEF